MKKDKVTLANIREAIRLLHKNMPPEKTQEFYWGWLTTDGSGIPVKIKLKRNQIKEIKRIMNMNFRFGRNSRNEPIKRNVKLDTMDGIKVVNQIRRDIHDQTKNIKRH